MSPRRFRQPWPIICVALLSGAATHSSTDPATTTTPALVQQSRPAQHANGSESCGRADPSYIRVANETGGQPFFFKRSEAARVGPFIQGTSGTNRELLLWATGTLTTGPQHFEFPVDSAVEQIALSLSVNAEGSTLVLRQPSGIPVGGGDSRVQMTELACSRIITIATPDPGDWYADVTGSGSFWIQARVKTEIFLTGAEFVAVGGRPGHEGLFRIAGQPLAGSPATLQIRLSGSVRTARFSLVALDGAPIMPIVPTMTSHDDDDREYVGRITLPKGPFRLAASGEDATGWPYRRVFVALFHAETVEVVPADSGVDRVRAGATSSIRFKVRNIGPKETFRIVAADGRRFVSRVDPQELTLASGASGLVTVDLTIPADATTTRGCDLTITATSASSITTNSAVKHLEMVAADPGVVPARR
jgi:von Willebrand factor A domain-containing protein 7